MRSWSIPLTLLLACGDNDDDDDAGDTDVVDADADTDADVDADTDADTDTDSDVDLDRSDVRWIHTSEALGILTVYMNPNTDPLLPSFDPFAGTPFQPVQAGNHSFAVSLEAAPPTEAIATLDGIFDADKRYTLAVYGPTTAPAIAQVLEDLSTPPLPQGQLRYRFWNVVDTIPTIDVTDEAMDMLLADDLAYGVPPGTLDLPAGARNVLVDLNNDGIDEYRYEIPAIGANVVVSFFFTTEAGVHVMLGQPAGGAPPVVLPPVVLVAE